MAGSKIPSSFFPVCVTVFATQHWKHDVWDDGYHVLMRSCLAEETWNISYPFNAPLLIQVFLLLADLWHAAPLLLYQCYNFLFSNQSCLSPFSDHTTKCLYFGIEQVPVVAIMTTGGGTRALTAMYAHLLSVQELKVLDSVSYITGLSGTTW